VSAAKGGDKREETLSFDRVLVAAGRKLNIDGLDLDTAGIMVKNNKIQLDKYLRTTNKRVYCCGDAAGDFQFTHWAEYQASVVIRNMIRLFKKPVNRDLAAWVTHTDPEVATFGLWCAAMEVRGIKYRTVTVPLEDVDRAVCEGIKEGLLKLYIAKGKIMGGTLIARNAGEIVGELIDFAALKIPFSRLNDRVYPYPTLSRINRKAVQQYTDPKLTGRSPGISKLLYKLFNR
jgi:pyruvate/2-oxoglutarate dehydrogenase complex dihydrolipoamide dehydrogenase (E3) component